MKNEDARNRLSLATQYEQMHESKRQWERFIWQTPVLLASIVGIIYALTAENDGFRLFENDWMNTIGTGFLAFFAVSLTTWAQRSRLLLRNIETELMKLEENENWVAYTKYPAQLNNDLRRIDRISSTKMIVNFLLITTLGLSGLFAGNLIDLVFDAVR